MHIYVLDDSSHNTYNNHNIHLHARTIRTTAVADDDEGLRRVGGGFELTSVVTWKSNNFATTTITTIIQPDYHHRVRTTAALEPETTRSADAVAGNACRA